MAIFGFGQQDPYAEAEQAAQDRQTAFAGMKDNLPALGLIAGLAMLARNNGTRSVGQLIGQAGGDALNAYGTWRKMEDVKARQKQLDDIAKEEREYQRTQDAFRNDMAERKLSMEQAKMAQDMALARQRLGMAAAELALRRQAAANPSLGTYDANLGGFVDQKTGKFTPLQFPEGYTPSAMGGMGIGMPKLTDNAKKEVANLMAMRDALDDAQSQFAASGGKYNGIVNGRTPNWTRNAEDAYNARLLEAGIGKMNAAFRKDTSGQAVTESEMKLLNEWLPSMTDTDADFSAKFENLDKEWMRRVTSLARAYNIPLEALMPSSSYGGRFGRGAGAAAGASAGIPNDIKWGTGK